MERREFLGWGASVAAGTWARGPWAFADTATVGDKSDPFDREGTFQVREGQLPNDLEGHLFIISPKHDEPGRPSFNGDGIVTRIDFGGSEPRFIQRVLKTPCYYADRAVAGSLVHRFRDRGIVRMSLTLGVRNQLNTALVASRDRLYATFDAGRPWEIDPISLKLVTPLGANDQWLAATPGIPGITENQPFPVFFSSAHAVVDRYTDELFTVNYGNIGLGAKIFTRVVRRVGDCGIETFDLVDRAGRPIKIEQSMHQMGLSQNYLVLADCSVRIEPEQLLNTEMSRPSDPVTRLFFVRRGDLRAGRNALAVEVKIPREMAHFTVDYEERNGMVVLHGAHISGADPSEWIRKSDRLWPSGGLPSRQALGQLTSPSDRAPVARYAIDPRVGKVTGQPNLVWHESAWGWALETHDAGIDRLDRIFWNTLGYDPALLTERIVRMYGRHPFRSVALSQLPREAVPGGIFRVDAQGEYRVGDGYTFPRGVGNSSPQLLGSHYLGVLMQVGTVNELWILRANALQEGPVCRLGSKNFQPGFTIHTHWMDSLRSAPAGERVSVRRDLRARVPFGLGKVFERSVFPYFDA